MRACVCFCTWAAGILYNVITARPIIVPTPIPKGVGSFIPLHADPGFFVPRWRRTEASGGGSVRPFPPEIRWDRAGSVLDPGVTYFWFLFGPEAQLGGGGRNAELA